MKKIQKRVNWKKEYDKLYEVYRKENYNLKEALYGWKHTMDRWNYSLDVNFIFVVLFLIGGVILGITITKFI